MTRARPLTRRLATGFGLTLIGALAACSSGSGSPAAPPPASRSAQPPAVAVTAITYARNAATIGAVEVVRAVSVIDAADAAAAVGDATKARTVRTASAQALVIASAQSPKIRAVQTTTYQHAVEILSQAAPATARERALVRAVITAASAEVETFRHFDTVADSAWVTFRGLDEAQATWLLRVDGGWYGSKQQSADAYAVLTDGPRSVVDANRAAIAAATVALRAASASTTTALRALEAAIGVVKR